MITLGYHLPSDSRLYHSLVIFQSSASWVTSQLLRVLPVRLESYLCAQRVRGMVYSRQFLPCRSLDTIFKCSLTTFCCFLLHLGLLCGLMISIRNSVHYTGTVRAISRRHNLLGVHRIVLQIPHSNIRTDSRTTLGPLSRHTILYQS